LRRTACRRPVVQLADDVLLQVSVDEFQNPPVTGASAIF
jgi:hypothetical protein